MAYSFIAYIDESGDEGLGARYRGDGRRGGSSRWLTVGACVMRANWESHAVTWRDEILNIAEKNTKTLHFTNLTHAQRMAATQHLITKPVRGITVLSNKTTIADGTFADTNQYYRYVTRHLIERISWLCRDYARANDGDGRVQIIFSRRGKMSYDDFRGYLYYLRNNIETTICWEVIDIDGIDAKDHSRNAGLQLADVFASAMSSGVDPDHYGNCECRYAEILKPVIYCHKRNYLSYGAKIIPGPDEQELSADQRRFIALFR